MNASSKAIWLRASYGTALVLALFTGFGNMPLYRRYYIADIPGFAWSGDFFVNLYVHYVAGAVLLGLSVYLGIQFWIQRRYRDRLTRSGLARAIALCLVLITGVIMVVKNLPWAVIPFPWVAVLTLGHMGLALVAAILYGFSAVKRWPWAKSRRRL